MIFISGRVWPHITATAKASKKPADIAVAYIGAKADKLLPIPPKSRLVIDASLTAVQAGSTNPVPLLTLHKQGVRIFSRPLLHAKTFVFDTLCIIGSPNASHRSANFLSEAALISTDHKTVEAARQFVIDMATDELDEKSLEWLKSQYNPPKPGTPLAPEEDAPTLVMELTDNQGYSGHQVQPPRPVWTRFFRVAPGDNRELIFRNRDTGAVIKRKVVSHALVRTVDIPGADAGTIWVVRQVGLDRYEYRVVDPTQKEFKALRKELQASNNPDQGRGRLWHIRGAPKK